MILSMGILRILRHHVGMLDRETDLIQANRHIVVSFEDMAETN